MTSKTKPRPTLPAIQAPVADEAVAHFPMRKGVATLPTKTISTKIPNEDDWSNIDPDDLFVRFTIPEIRNIQVKLRADADAKQEELRLMVGERYRDLLQASTSIITIADSSKRVINALTDMREAMVTDENEQKPRRSSVRGKDDAHLKTLQSLSAHLKLLLDAPEHLWRLLEKKQHLPAAWLFLLARVVHRGLITEDPEESWEHEGINVSSQFPLVQRQWDTLAQFRSQIAHRATQYLRESSISSETACSTALTLHLLDSLPLPETLSTLLSQRSRTLNALFMRNLDFRSPLRPASPVRKKREVTGKQLSSSGATTSKTGRHRKAVVKIVRVAVLELLEIIGGTMCIARDVFRAEDGRKSLVERSLEEIQSDTPPNSMLTTSSLLSTLPSSTHLLTLPQSILSYKPYIDLTSPSTHVDPPILDAKLSAWFDKAIEGFEGRIHTWFKGLQTIREVWDVRRKVLQRLQATRGLEDPEKARIRVALNDGVKGRANEVTRSALKDVEEAVDYALREAVQDVRDEIEAVQMDVSPSTFLFSSPPIPPVSHLSANTGIAMTSFKSFKHALRQRVDGRTPSLDKLLSGMESKAEELEEDLEVMNEDDRTSRELRQEVMATHYPVAQLTLNKIIEILEKLLSLDIVDAQGPSEKSINVVVFLGRISHGLVSSPFAQSLRCQDDALQGFRDALKSLHERSLIRWRTHSVSKALERYMPVIAALKDTPAVAAEFTWPSQPTPYLINSLLSLTSSLQDLGLSRTELWSKHVTTKVMHDFKASIANEIPPNAHGSRRQQAELLLDLTFLTQLSHVQNGSSEHSNSAKDVLSLKVEFLQSHLRASTQEETIVQLSTHIDRAVDPYLLRCQTLLAPLVSTVSLSNNPETNGKIGKRGSISTTKASALLPLGVPVTDQDFRPAMEVVKPSARFGLLSMGTTIR